MPERKEMKHASDKMINELANDYAAYIKVDLPNKASFF